MYTTARVEPVQAPLRPRIPVSARICFDASKQEQVNSSETKRWGAKGTHRKYWID